MSTNGHYTIYVGTYDEDINKSIYYYSFDADKQSLSLNGSLDGEDHSSFQIIDEQRQILYTTCNLADGSGGVASYRIDPGTKTLRLIHTQSTEGGGPAYISLVQDGRFLLAANYRGGSVSVLPVSEDGTIRPVSDVIAHHGSGQHAKRQEGPHPHSIQPGLDGAYIYACDLGTDRIVVYTLDVNSGKLVQCHEIAAAPGAGPRHMAFHPEAAYAYVINELDNTVTAYSYDAASGALTGVQTVSTLPEDFNAENTAADLHFSPCGNFLYGSNRGHDSIVAYQVDPDTGKLSLIGHTSTQGKGPRNFAISSDGRYVFAANQGSGSLTVFARDTDSGALSPVAFDESMKEPVCVTLLK